MMKKFLRGRSMIEMLGVLAVIGVLSVGALSMYRTAMLRYRLGQTQYWIENVRFIIAEACANGNKNVCYVATSGTSLGMSYTTRADYVCSQSNQFLCPNGKLRTPLKEKGRLLHMRTTSSFTLYLDGLDKKTCKEVVNYDWNGLRSIDNYTNWSPSESVLSGHKYLTQEQKDRLSEACPFPMYIVLTFDLNS